MQEGKFRLDKVGNMAKAKGFAPSFYGDGLYYTSCSHTAKGYGLAPGKNHPPWNLQDFVSKDAGNAVFVVSVLVGKPDEVKDRTTSGLPRGTHSRVVAKHTGVDELVVFNEAQALPTHVIVFG
mmetsp:Transcript_371/g.1089  ORF Transcript_371/g.1089 Transcript_371/m.1089 type:complete len:123 (+) Transcript_371:3-371(+)